MKKTTKKVTTVPYESPKGFHRHKCNHCNHIWEHGEGCFCKIEPHKCPNCGNEQWVKYKGPEPPTPEK